MIDNLIRFSIRNKLVIGVFILVLIGWGIYSLFKLPIDAVPDITNNQVQVVTTSPTLAASEIEQFITYPVELAMATIPDVVEIRSISRLGLSVITIVFKDEVDIYKARALVFQRLKVAESQIPNGLGQPEMTPITTGLGEIYQYVLRPKAGYEDKYSPMELRTIQDWIVKRQLLGTPGVADVSSFGGFLKQYQVSVSPEKLRSMGISIAEVFDALEQNNSNTGGAYIEKGPNATFIRGLGLVKSIDDIEKIVVKNVDRVPILIRDIGRVEFGHALRYGALTRNGQGEVVGGIVLMLKNENSAEVVENVKKKVKTIEKSLPEGVVIDVFLDRTKLIDKTIGTVSENLIEGGLIVIFVLVLLLGNIRAGLVVASVIPLSMLFAISMMNLLGISGNLMSLGAIDFGLIVDGAVIIVESIVHRITSDQKLASFTRLNQAQMDNVVMDGAIKIRKSAAFGEIIILIVYIPILTLVGIEGKMFRPMAQTVGLAILGALILSLTYVPMISALFLSKETKHKRNYADKIIEKLHSIYEPVLRKALIKRKEVIISSFILFFVSIAFFSRMGGEFMPTLNEGDLAIESSIAPGSSLSQSVKTFSLAEKILLEKFPNEVKEVISKIGTAEIPTDPMPVESADVTIILKEQDEWKKASSKNELVEKMEDALSAIPGLNAEFSQPIQLRFNELITGVKQDIAIKIFGEDLDVLFIKANEAAKIINPIQGIGDMKVEQTKGFPQILVKYNRTKIAQYGLSIDQVNRVLNTAFAGAVTGVVYEGDKRFDLVVRLGEESRKSLTDVENLFIPLPDGAQVPLSEVALVNYEEGPMQISREDTKRRITIGINVRNRDVESLVNEIQSKLETNLKLPPGYYITYGGQFENLQAAKNRLLIAVPVALALIFILLFFTFGSLKQSLLIFTAIPLAAVGGIFALILRDMPFSISAGVGFIALFGVAVLNGIVLIGYFNQLRKEGMKDVYQRVLEGTKVRLRPVILTAAVASLGFLPMALSQSEGAEVQRPLATVVIGGLITSTLLTLIVLPVLYTFIEGVRANFNNKATYLGIALLAVTSFTESAKSQITEDAPRSISMEEAVNIGIEGNPGIKSTGYQVQSQEVLKATSFNLDRTFVGAVYGKTNSVYNDNAFKVSQNVAFPSVYFNESNVAKARIKEKQLQLSFQKRELARTIKKIYVQAALINERLKILLFQDSIYTRFNKAAEIRFKTGETAYLEKLAAETRLMEVRNALFQAKSDSAIFQNQLQKILRINEPIRISNQLTDISRALIFDTAFLNQNPYLDYLKQQIAIRKAQTQLEKSRLLPDFTFGYTSQTLRGYQNIDGTEQFFGGSDRFDFVEAGVGIPLWVVPQKARIQASKIEEKVAETNYLNEKIKLESEYQTLIYQFQKLQNTLQYYQEKALPQSNLVIEFAEKSFRAGEIGYLEYLQNLLQGLQIKLSYLDALNNFNQEAINLEFLLGGTK